MRKFRLLLTIATVLLLLTACSDEKAPENRYKTGDLPDGMYQLGVTVGDVYLYDNKIYTIGEEIGCYDIQTKSYTTVCEIEPEYQGTSGIFVDESGIYTTADGEVRITDFDGNVTAAYKSGEIKSLSLEDEHYYNDITSNGRYIAVNTFHREKVDGRNRSTYKILLIDMKTGENTAVDYKTEKDSDYIISILPTEKADEFYIVGYYYIHSLNAKTGEIKLVSTEYADSCLLDYAPEDRTFYCAHEYLGYLYLSNFNLHENDFQTTRTIGMDRIFKDIKRIAGDELEYLLFYDRPVFYTGYDYVIYERPNNIVCVLSPTPGETGESITVLYDSPYNNSDSMGMRRMSAEFENDYDAAVKTKRYDSDSFIERLRVKMMAGDDDYDVVMLTDADKILASLLKYNLYLPLENYPEITKGFKKYIDGVRDVMTYDGHIYGIPYTLDAMSIVTSDESAKSHLPSLPTVDDFFSLCESTAPAKLILADQNYPAVFKSSLKSILEDGVEKGEISREAILNFVVRYMEYYNSGVLDQASDSGGVISAVEGTSRSNTTSVNHDYHTAILRPLPSYNGKNYIDVKKIAYINSVTKNPDLAAEYLSYMVSDDFISENSAYDKTMLARDFDSYFYYTVANFDNGYKPEKKILTQHTEGMQGFIANALYYANDKFLVEHGSDLFVNAAPRLYTYNVDDILENVFTDMTEGNMTPEEGAEKIYTEAKLRLLE